MTPITSSAASLTDSARNRVPGASAPTPASTAWPPPSGMWTSSRTTSGLVRRMSAIASATVSASPTTSTASPSSVRTPDRNSRWSSTRTTRGRGWSFTRSVPRSLTGHLQADFGALVEHAADGGGPTVALHPAGDGLSQAEAVGRDVRGNEAGPAIPDEDRDPGWLHLCVDADLVDAGVLGRVDHRLPGGRDQRAHARVHGTVTDDHDLDGHAVGLLDLGGRSLEGSRQLPAVGCCWPVEPGPQLALLAAGEPPDLTRVIRGFLDQRERLQNRVVHVGRGLRPLLGPDPLPPLVAQIRRHPEPERGGQHGKPGDDDRGGDQALPGGTELAARGEEAGQPDHEQSGAGEHPCQATRPGCRRAPA